MSQRRPSFVSPTRVLAKLSLSLTLLAATALLLLPSVQASSQYVQYSFCLIAGTASTALQTASTYNSVSYGVATTSTLNASYEPSGRYTVTSISAAFQYTVGSPTPVSLTLAPAGSLTGNPACCGNGGVNNNVLYVTEGAAVAGTDNSGFGLYSSDSTFTLWDTVHVQCTSGSCGGPFAQLTVQQYSSKAAGKFVCEPLALSAVVQFSFCLISGNSPNGLQTTATYNSVAYGIFTTTTPLPDYSPSASYIVGSVLNGFTYTSGARTPVNLTLALPSSLTGNPACCGNGGINSNFIYVTEGAIGAGTDNNGLGLYSSYGTFAFWDSLHVQCTSGPCGGPYGQLTVQQYTAGSGRIACAPAAVSTVVQFAFCLITGSSSAGSQTWATYTSVSYGIFTTNVPQTVYSPASSGYYVGSVLSGFQYTVGSPTPTNLSVAPPGTLTGNPACCGNGGVNDDYIYVTEGDPVGSTNNNGLGLYSAYATFAFWDGYHVQCTAGNCGVYGQMTLQAYTPGTSMPPCTPAPIEFGGFVQNSGFESGSFSSFSLKPQQQKGNVVVTGSSQGFYPHSGQSFALLGALGSANVIAQTVTVPQEAVYNLTLWLASDGGLPNGLTVNGQFQGSKAVNLLSLVNVSASAYSSYSAAFYAPAGSGSVNLTLSIIPSEGSGYLALDDVSLVEQ